tara:strand:- start:354 stop:491 length:138 start_codon:yes stop_codon:yes gene_type:complete
MVGAPSEILEKACSKKLSVSYLFGYFSLNYSAKNLITRFSFLSNL